MISHDADAALARLMRFLSVPGITGQEQAIGLDVGKALVESGVPTKAVGFVGDHRWALDRRWTTTSLGTTHVTSM